MGFRQAIIDRIKELIIQNMVIDDPNIEYQNDVPGYSGLNSLKLGDGMTAIGTSSPGNTYKAPREPKPGRNIALRRLLCRPIRDYDVTGIRASRQAVARSPSPSPSPNIETDLAPQAFLHIISGEKDIYWPQRNAPNIGRLSDQVEYFKIGIDCVVRDETGSDPATRPALPGNGLYWLNQVEMGKKPSLIPEIARVAAVPPSGGSPGTPAVMYRPLYHQTINEQVVGFVEDMEVLLNPDTLVMSQTYKFGANDEYEARVLNTNLAIWGMLPDSVGSATDTVRCIFELQVQYPKVYR